MKPTLVCGFGSLMDNYLVKRLIRKGYLVRRVDIEMHRYIHNNTVIN